MSATIARRPRTIATVRAGWGLLLVLAPARLVTCVPGVKLTGRRRAVARILGARHALQGTAALAGSELAQTAWWVDGLHAASMLALAIAAPSERRLASSDATVAAAFAALTRCARRS
ncbi:MAG: hypothetical protein ACYCXW_10575 [Solirubrobacteraceae bacterium]